MTQSPILNRKLFALLIGVDFYLPNLLPDGGYYPSLGGCVRDVNHVESFLKGKLGITDAQIIKLTATNGGGLIPTEPEEMWPTYENIVLAFQKVILNAQEGDQVYIHYSGHGGRTVTNFPELKGQNGLDESLVPTDIGRPGTRYVRDVEMAYLLKQMGDKKLVVTIVLDSCHSGGATRGLGGGAVRGISSIDTTERPTDSLVATREELTRTWQAIPAAQTRNASLGSGWVPEMNNTILLAACRANEVANEFAFEGQERDGALTYWLLDSLKQIGPGLTFRMIHNRILVKINAKFPQQTPQLHGDETRVVFDTNRVPQPHAVLVLQVDRANRRLKLDVGKAQGVGVGARYAIYPAQATDFTQGTGQSALAEITDAQATESWAAITETINDALLEEGGQAMLLDAGDVQLRGRIRLVQQDNLQPGINQSAALQQLTLEIQKSSWIRLAKDEEGADYQVAINANSEYEVWDPNGHLISNLRPVLKIGDVDAPVQLARRLVHLTKYRNAKLIDNSASNASLARLLTIELVGAATTAPGGVPVLNVGESAKLRIKNSSSKVLNITIFDLRPDWGVKQVYPDYADSEILDPDGLLELPLENVGLPQGYMEGVDTVKVFATIEPTSFRVLELPALDQPLKRSVAKRGVPANPLEQLMAEFAADAPSQNLRSFNLVAPTVATWTVVQLDFRVRQPVQAPRHVREPDISLLQAAFDEVAAENKEQARVRGERGAPLQTTRASINDPILNAVTDYWLDPTLEPPPPPSPTTERGALDTVKYCASMTAHVAREAWNVLKGDTKEFDAYKAALTTQFTSCDPRFGKALVKYLEFLRGKGKVPYRRWQQLSDFVIEGKLPPDATIGIVADWGTGQPEAIEVLRQVKGQNPQVAMHLGDVYYAGTAYEMENYFYKPWQDVLQPETSGVVSFALPGNHDLYSGGQPFYDLIDKFGQPASYFCLRNKHWQLISIDTALHDTLGGPPTSLEPSEVEWLRDKIENAEGRRTMLLSHHQLFSTNERFGDKSFNENLYRQLEDLLPKVDLWFWGHEHDLIIFGEYMGLKRGRCIGGSAFPVGKYEQPTVQQNFDVPFNRQVALSKGAAFYQHCYAIVKLDESKATVSYYEDDAGGRVLFTEIIE